MAANATLIYDGECGVCLCARKLTEPLDLLRSIEWVPYQHPAAEAFGIPFDEMKHSVHFINRNGRRCSGFAAVKQVMLRLPPLYGVAALGLRSCPKFTVAALALFFSPFFQPVGQWMYEAVSTHRRGLPRNLCGESPPVAEQLRPFALLRRS